MVDDDWEARPVGYGRGYDTYDRLMYTAEGDGSSSDGRDEREVLGPFGDVEVCMHHPRCALLCTLHTTHCAPSRVGWRDHVQPPGDVEYVHVTSSLVPFLYLCLYLCLYLS